MGQQALGDPVIAQSAFFYDAFVSQPRTGCRFLSGVIVIGNDIAADFFSNLLRRRSAPLDQSVATPPMGVGSSTIKRDDTIGTHGLAGPASDALFRRVHRNVAVSIMHRFSGAAPYTGRILTLITQRGQKLESDIGEFAFGFRYRAGPGDAPLDIVFALTGNEAPPAARTSLKVYDHRNPLVFRS